MAYVITQACISVKDTACVDACPTDAIHAYADSPQFYIDPATCIDCNACEPVCPVKAIFPGDQVPQDQKKFIPINIDFFKTFDKSKSASYTRQKKEGDTATPTAEGASKEVSGAAADSAWVEQAGWELEWEKYRDEPVDRVEEQKRYGRVRAVYELADRYVIRFFLPERLPSHPYVFKFGLPREMPTYQVSAVLQGSQTAVIRGKIADPKVARLSGLANSFPDRFYVEYTFDHPISSVSVTSQGLHVVDVIAIKEQDLSKAA